MEKLLIHSGSTSDALQLLGNMGFNLHFVQQLARTDAIQERTTSSDTLLIHRYRLNGSHPFHPLKDRKLQKFVDWLHGKKHLLTTNFPSPNALWNYYFTLNNQSKNTYDPVIEEFEIRLYDAKTIDELADILEKLPLKGKIQSLDKRITYEVPLLIDGLRKIAKWHERWNAMYEAISAENKVSVFQARVKKLLSGNAETGEKSRTDQIKENIEQMKTQVPNVIKYTTRAHNLRAHVGRILSQYDGDGKYKVPLPPEDQEKVIQLYTTL